MKAFPALRSRSSRQLFPKGANVGNQTQTVDGTGGCDLPGRSRGDLSFGETVTQTVLVASQFPDPDILVQDLPGFGAG